MCFLIGASDRVTNRGGFPNRSHEEKEARFWSRYLFSQYALVCVSIGVGVVAYFNLTAIRTTLHQTTREVAEQVLINRPVVFQNGQNFDREHGPPNEYQPVLVNFGHSVALEIGVVGALRIADHPRPEPVDTRCIEDGRAPKDTRLFTLASQAALSVTPPWRFEGPTADIIGVDRGKFLFAVGCVYYKGLDGERWFSSICSIWRDGDFWPCEGPMRYAVY